MREDGGLAQRWGRDQTAQMPFGDHAGPPASAKQLEQLLALLQEAGHSDFRDARGPMGFSQRQAGGRFTRAEAEQLIDQLQSAADEGQVDGGAPTDAAAATSPTPAPRTTAAERAVQRIPTGQLAAELQRRGWIVIEP